MPAVPVSNVSFSDIQAEFGGSAPISLSEYYRGGAYVDLIQPKSSLWPTQISTGGEISVGMFRGLRKAVHYFFDGSSLAGWTVHPQITTASQSVTVVEPIGGNPGAHIATRADGWKRNWFWRNVNFSTFNHFSLSFHSLGFPIYNSILFVQLGASGGNGRAFALYRSKISTCNFANYGSVHSGVIDIGSHVSTAGNWKIYKFDGTRLSPDSFSVDITITDFSTNSVVFSANTVVPFGMGGNEWAFRYTADSPGGGFSLAHYHRLDNIELILY